MQPTIFTKRRDAIAAMVLQGLTSDENNLSYDPKLPGTGYDQLAENAMRLAEALERVIEARDAPAREPQSIDETDVPK
ncbi:MAG TPA: hypothetical protein PK198_14195 [Saprospiraceae bacterium]|nr:hypothetical protein [Saprospiraceae bacterium]HRK80221.1 hypothetical protein [Saprospiraceae bacterium]